MRDTETLKLKQLKQQCIITKYENKQLAKCALYYKKKYAETEEKLNRYSSIIKIYNKFNILNWFKATK